MATDETTPVDTPEQPVAAPDRMLTDADLDKVSGGVGGAPSLNKMEVEPVDFKPKGSLFGLQVEPVDFTPKI